VALVGVTVAARIGGLVTKGWSLRDALPPGSYHPFCAKNFPHSELGGRGIRRTGGKHSLADPVTIQFRPPPRRETSGTRTTSVSKWSCTAVSRRLKPL